MDALKILSTIRSKECDIWMLYRELARKDEVCAATQLNVSFSISRKLQSMHDQFGMHLMNAFNANTSTLFVMAAPKIVKIDTSSPAPIENEIQQEIRRIERKIVLELRDLACEDAAIAAACCGLTKEQILSLERHSVSEVIEFCFQSRQPLLKFRAKRESWLANLVDVAAKPQFSKIGYCMDQMTI